MPAVTGLYDRATPSAIADDAAIAISHISRALAELREHGTAIWETIETQNSSRLP